MDLTLPAIFGAGVLTFFTPCVLPMIPLYLSALLGVSLRAASGVARGTLVGRSLAFALGFIAVFALLGAAAGGLAGVRRGGQAWVHLGGGLLILLFGLRFTGLIQIPLLERALHPEQALAGRRLGLASALGMGVLFAVGWSPCVGPVLGSVLTYAAATSANVPAAVGMLTVYGLGFALPLLLTAAFAEAGLALIRRAGRLLPAFERAMGLVLLVAAAGLLHGAVSGASSDVLAADGPASAAAAGGTGRATDRPAAGEFTDPTVPDRFPLMVEFYARDCPVCQRMAPVVAALKAECNYKKVEIRQVDIDDAGLRRVVNRFNLVGVPTFVFIDLQGREVARLIGEQTEQGLRQAISALRGEPCPGVGALPASYLRDVDGQASSACGSEASAP